MTACTNTPLAAEVQAEPVEAEPRVVQRNLDDLDELGEWLCDGIDDPPAFKPGVEPAIDSSPEKQELPRELGPRLHELNPQGPVPGWTIRPEVRRLDAAMKEYETESGG